MAKEQILDEHEGKGYASLRTRAIWAMDEYAKQVAIDFIEWTLKANVEPIGDGLWEDHSNQPMGSGSAKVVTSAELYKSYLKNSNP